MKVHAVAWILTIHTHKWSQCTRIYALARDFSWDFETHLNVRHGHNFYVSSHFQALYVVYDKRVKTITTGNSNSNTHTHTHDKRPIRKVLWICTEFWCLQWIWSISACALCTLSFSIAFMQMHFVLFLYFTLSHTLTVCLAHICMVNIFAACLHSSTFRCGLNDIVVVFTISVMLVGLFFFVRFLYVYNENRMRNVQKWETNTNNNNK